jgi:predicted nucleic acid-binding Zn ribbon protein
VPRSPGIGGRPPARSDRPRPLGEVVEEVLADPAFARGVPVGRLAAAWAEVVGPRLAAETAPASLEGGVLTVEASTGPWGAQARFLGEEIRRKANAALGGEVVRAVRVVVGARGREALERKGSGAARPPAGGPPGLVG